ncbi:alpha-1,3-mannosyl-glycoprotein 4-beta-N-acetylglucosaminyltransferase B-like isoform X2 [Tubulanus polymorphus]|uniref:alpha-1,3-mannosyl-glycoprotein 4-beta-N-acetylglucosaminyltransferase B-like isoform X2 n=1 Tax=Tubulanus polymorphus TaxID=672921 RepID=UPI003DA4D1DA
MRIYKKSVLLLVVGLLFVFITWIAVLTGPDLNREELLQKKLSELRDRVHFVDTLNKEREHDIMMLRRKFHILHEQLRKISAKNESLRWSAGMPEYLRQVFSNLSLANLEVQPPNIFHLMPHLSEHPEALVPKFKVSNSRKEVVGIPTIKREEVIYLYETLKSVLDGLNDEEKDDCLIIVFIAEPDDLNYIHKLANDIKTHFPAAVDSGLLEIISPSALFYPNFDEIRQTLGDSKQRVKWRTKQNLDYSFLMMYARTKGTYYVQLEDDVITKPGFFSVMKNFALNQKSEDWILLEFSLLGFIGKLFKSADLPTVIEFFLMFYKDKPIDWLLDHLLNVKTCHPEKDNKHCERMKASVRIKYKPSLFQHIGIHSSLKGKIQKLKDRSFVVAKLHRAHANPPAEVSTTLKVFHYYHLDRAYRGETFFWGLIPHPGDVVLFNFSPPIEIEGYYFKSGNAEHPGDQLYNTTVEVLPKTYIDKDLGSIDNKPAVTNYPRTNDGYLIIGSFSLGVAQNTVLPSIGPVTKLRLHIHSASANWVILSEIHIKAMKRNTGSSPP